MTQSLRQRLALTHAALVAVTVAAVGLIEHRWHRQELHDRLDAGLVAVAAAQAASAVDSPTETKPHIHRMQAIGTEPATRVALLDPTGRPLSVSSRSLSTPAVARMRPGFATLTINGEPWRVYRQPLRVRGLTYALIVGQDLSPIERAERGQWYLLVGWLIAGMAGSAALGTWLADRASKPVRDLADKARLIGPDAITERLPVPDTGDELAVLAHSLNRMLTRLEQAFTAQQRFVHDAAHEVRTPLAALRTNLEVTIRRLREPEAYAEAIREALAEIDRLTRIVNQLLTLERCAADGQRQVVAAAPLVAAALQRFQSVADQHGVTLLSEGDGQVLADPGQLEQVLDNLLSNAIRYSPAGGIVRVTVAPEGTQVAIRVSDAGPGIPPEERDAVFDRFHRVDPARHHATGGSGLGLAICRAIVDAHEGTIAIEPSPSGTIVRIALPAATVPVA
jgi:heavy metal sensor kinase